MTQSSLSNPGSDKQPSDLGPRGLLWKRKGLHLPHLTFLCLHASQLIMSAIESGVDGEEHAARKPGVNIRDIHRALALSGVIRVRLAI